MKVKAFKTTQSDYRYIQYNLPGVGQRRKSLKTRSKKQARSNGSKIATALAGGTLSGRRKVRVTIADAAKARCERLRQLGRSPKLVENYERVYRRLAAWMRPNGTPHVEELTEARLEGFEAQLRQKGVEAPRPQPTAPPAEAPRPDRRRQSPPPKPLHATTVRHHMKAVRGLIRFALRRGLIDREPAPAYEMPRGGTKEVEVYSPKELAWIFADPDPDMADVWQFAFDTCLRVSELTWLTKDDVIRNALGHPKAVLIRRKKCPLSGKAWSPKHGMHRIVPLTARAADIVARRMTKSTGPWLFEAPDTLTAQTGKWRAERLLIRLRLKAGGITHGGMHTFRHSGASYLANAPSNAMPPVQLQRFLGHKRLMTTEVYLHTNADDLGEALARVGPPPTVQPAVGGTQQNGSPSQQTEHTAGTGGGVATPAE